MLERSFGLYCFLKRAKVKECTYRYVYLRITVNGESKELSLKRRWQQARWNQTTGRALGTKEDAQNLNAYLDLLCAKIYRAKSELIESERKISARSLKDFIIGNGSNGTILGLISTHNKRMELLVGKGFSEATLKRYNTVLHCTKSFIRWKYQAEDLDMNELDYEFISDYAYWLKAIRGNGNNSVAKYVGNLKKIVNETVRRGWLKNDPFAGFRTVKDEVVRVALTADELSTISHKIFPVDRLNNVRDIFLFCCYTGLAYVDVKNLTMAKIERGVDGGL